jgi:hypothetical protein
VDKRRGQLSGADRSAFQAALLVEKGRAFKCCLIRCGRIRKLGMRRGLLSLFGSAVANESARGTDKLKHASPDHKSLLGFFSASIQSVSRLDCFFCYLDDVFVG